MSSQQKYEQNQQHILAFIREYLEERQRQAETAYRLNLPDNYDSIWSHPENSHLYYWLDQINRASCGLVEATPGSEEWEEVHDAIQKILEMLFYQPGLGAAYEPPDSFWGETPLGRMVRDAQLWVAEDELITQGQAAEICNKSIQSINNWIREGKLAVYSDGGLSHRPGGRLVSKNQVTSLCAGN